MSGRPFHTPNRNLRDAPDETEPSYSYEEKSFLERSEDSMEDEFHRRMAGRSSGGGAPHAASGGSGSGSFWRTDVAPEQNWSSISKPPTTVKERKTSGGLLGAALQLHSQSEGTSSGHMKKPSASGEDIYRRSGSARSESSAGSANKKDHKKKDVSKQRAEARRLKFESQTQQADIGHVEDGAESTTAESIGREEMKSLASTHSEGSGDRGPLLLSAGRTMPRTGGTNIFAKSSSLIFPTGVEPASDSKTESQNLKKHKINLLLDQCESVRFPFKKKLMLNSLNLRASEIPVKDLYGTSLGNSLYKLSLAGNRLSHVPPKLVVCLPVLKQLDLSQCELHQLPSRWNLPQLKRLNLSHNQLMEFPEESMLEGLMELQELNMYGNKVSMLVVPHNPKYLAKLEILNLGYNDLLYLPEDLDRLKALRTLKVMNNFLEKIPMRICDMELKSIDVTSNPVIQPPIETCERGICSMKRYYQCLREEARTTPKALEKAINRHSTGHKPTKPKTKKSLFSMLGRKTSDDTNSQQSSARDETEQSQTTLNTLHVKPSDAFKLATEDDASTTHISSGSGPSRSVSLNAIQASSDMLSNPLDMARAKTHDTISPLASKSPAFSISPEAGTTTVTPPEELSAEDVMDDITINDTLKVIFVGMALAGKTSMIKRLIEGENAVIPKRDERTVGVDIYEWDPKIDRRFEHIDSHIEIQDAELKEAVGDVNVKLSVWDFAGQHVYHATHELFFSPRALYVLVWDMGANNPATKSRHSEEEAIQGAFSLNYDSDNDSSGDDDDFTQEEEARRADRALERDIDDKVQFWVDCIQTSAPGAAILPVASFDDFFSSEDGGEEAKRRCRILRQRLEKHETRRLQGIKDRLKEYYDENRANDEAALRLRKLLNSYTRPKLIFGQDETDPIVRVSGTLYTGFADLTERIINIATGCDNFQWRYPIFRGHVGARIPRMRLQVRQAVRHMRDRFKVVEWGYFINQLSEVGLTSVEDISDALHFLTNIGELSYFGGVLPDRNQRDLGPSASRSRLAVRKPSRDDDGSAMSFEDDNDDVAYLSLDNTEITMPETDDGSISTLGDTLTGGLSQFVFLNPRWLVAAVACILRHDLDREIRETRRSLAHGHKHQISRGESFYEANMNCPVITADDACLLWQAKKFTKKAAERAEEYSNDLKVKPFEFLQLLLIRFGVFVPIDLGIEKAFLGGVEYAHRLTHDDESSKPEVISVPNENHNSVLKAAFFFLPSLLGPGEPAEAWTYKNTDSWKATLSHTVLFPDGVPPGLMERITASVLSNIYAIAHHKESSLPGMEESSMPVFEGRLGVKEVLCWRTAFLVKIGMQVDSENKESIVEVFCGLLDKESHLCVGSDYMGASMRRLVVSGKGQEGDSGRKIWMGGYLIVLKAMRRVLEEYGGLEYEKQAFCPECLSKKAVGGAGFWDFTMMRRAVVNGEQTIWCTHGHRVSTHLVAGPVDGAQKHTQDEPGSRSGEAAVPINDLLRGAVVVGLWDGKSRKVVRVGSGFIADKKRGLIVTASHTLMNIWGDKNTPFGENYYGLRQGKVVIGVIPRNKGEEVATEAVFRYFAKLVAKDPDIDKGVCHLDACVLKITTRMENDVSGIGEGCDDQPERLLLNNPHALKQEKFHQLKITEKCELDEQVRIVGYNQGGEGLMGPGVRLNRYVDFARGYVCKKFAGGEGEDSQLRHRFKPREEIVVICPTIGGHSGGPCVNQQGEVIGILSRADPAETQRCYLVPAHEWKPLLKEAKSAL